MRGARGLGPDEYITAGRQWFIRSALITSLPDEVIHKTVDDFADTPVGCSEFMLPSILFIHAFHS